MARLNEREMGERRRRVIGIRLAPAGTRWMGHGHHAGPAPDILVLTETSYGKRVVLNDFRSMHPRSQALT